ncbi:DUF6895 family protein [Spirillospora sp. NPDC050679]
MSVSEPWERIADNALRWLADNAPGFRLTADVLSPDTPLGNTLKPLGELVQISSVVLRKDVHRGRHAQTAGELIELAWDELQHGDLLLALLHAEPLTSYPLELYATMRQAGLRHRGMEELAARTVATHGWAAREMTPTHRLGVLNAERRLGLPLHTDLQAVAARTWTGHRPEPHTIDWDSAYDLTHTVFHLTDWGRHPDRLPADIASYLNDWLPAWTQVWCEDRDWDLLGELLAVDACLPRPALDQHAWQQLAQAQHADGAVAPIRWHDDHDAFTNYRHPTLVATFAATLATSRARNLAPTG